MSRRRRRWRRRQGSPHQKQYAPLPFGEGHNTCYRLISGEQMTNRNIINIVLYALSQKLQRQEQSTDGNWHSVNYCRHPGNQCKSRSDSNMPRYNKHYLRNCLRRWIDALGICYRTASFITNNRIICYDSGQRSQHPKTGKRCIHILGASFRTGTRYTHTRTYTECVIPQNYDGSFKEDVRS